MTAMKRMKFIHMIFCLLLALSFAGCSEFVLEYPDTPEMREVTFHLKHKNGWNYIRQISDRVPSRAAAPDTILTRYIMRAYSKNTRANYCVSEKIVYSDKLYADSIDIQMPVPAGDWDIRVWCDYVGKESKQSLYYNADDFAGISIRQPYAGSDIHKEAFVGHKDFSVPDIYDLEWKPTDTYIELERPLSAFVLVTTDLEKFVRSEIRRQGPINIRHNAPAEQDMNAPSLTIDGVKIPLRDIDLSRYRVRLYYTGYLPSVFHHFSNRPIDAVTGMYFDSEITLLVDNNEAMIAFDHILVNGITSGVSVAVELYDNKNNKLASVGTSTIPLKRGDCTIIRGEFLTSQTGSGTTINPDFDGEFNIKI